MIKFNWRVTLVWLTSINRISILQSTTTTINLRNEQCKINNCRSYRFDDAWDIPDEEIAKTRIMNSLVSIQSPNAYQVQWTHKWKYDSVKESKSQRNKYAADCGYMATKSFKLIICRLATAGSNEFEADFTANRYARFWREQHQRCSNLYQCWRQRLGLMTQLPATDERTLWDNRT